MKHAALAALALLFWPIQGTTFGWVFTALMLAAIKSDWRREREHAARIRRAEA